MRIWKVEVSNEDGVWSSYLGLAPTAQVAITAAVKMAACELAPENVLYASRVEDIGQVQFRGKK